MTYETIPLTIPNRRNLKLAAEIFRPEGDGPFPVVFLIHGFTGYKEDAGLVDIAKKLAENGMISVRFTASGFGDSEGSMENDYLFRHYRTDAECVHEYVINNVPGVDAGRVGVYGHSMGGKLAVLFCAEHPVVRAVCVGSAPVGFVGTAYEAELPRWKKQGYFEKISGRDGKTIRIPYAYVEDEESEKHDVLVAAMRVTSPQALAIAGDLDHEVPWQQTRRIYDALPCPKDFQLLKEVPHKYSKSPVFSDVVVPLVANFFVTHL